MRSRPQPRAWLLVVGYVCASLGLCAGLGVVGHARQQSPSPPAGARAAQPEHVKSAAYELLDIALEATAREHERNGPRPTVGSRMLGIVVTAMYDAWAAYDEKAVGTQLGGKLRRPAAERTEANKKKALAYATYRALVYLFPEDEKWLSEQIRQYGFDPADNSTDVTTPQGVGNTAAAALIEYRRRDGANQGGDELGSDGKPYSDYTFYKPVNLADKIRDADCWQPIPFDDTKGGHVTPGFLTPHWYRVKTFALRRSDQFRPGPPPKVGSEQLKKEVDEVLAFNASLTPEQKAIVEFMRDGPRSTGQSGHWLRFAQAVSRRDRHDIDKDVKIFFAVGNVAMDAFIAAWESKRYYDSSRPWTLVRHYYAGQKVSGWAGPGKGVATMRADDWHPYSPYVFITPPFPGYVSGHSAVSAASAKVLELFTGSDHFGEKEKRKAGMLTEAEFECARIQMREGQSASDAKTTCDVVLDLPTFTATAEMAGISRVMGGYHIQADNVAGLELGRKVALYVWPVVQSYFDGTAKGGGGELAGGCGGAGRAGCGMASKGGCGSPAKAGCGAPVKPERK
jgi:hypothetical protein